MTVLTAPERFERIASNYVTSEVHKSSASMTYVRAFLSDRADLHVLDVACGAGHFGFNLADAARRLVFCDPSAAMLASVAAGAAARGVAVETAQAVAEALPFEAGEFDLVVSRLAPHHFTDLPAALGEIARVLAPGGHCAIIDLEGAFDAAADAMNHTLEVLHDPTHVRSYSQLDWCAATRAAGLSIERVQGGLRESPNGVTVERWCQIAGTEPEAKAEIEDQLTAAPADTLAALGIWHDGAEFRLPVRTTLLIASRP